MFKKWLNKLEKKITYISNQQYKPDLFSFESLLICISYIYAFGVRIRLYLYSKGILKQNLLPCFVISIGNIVVGGTGKTPMAVYVAKLLKKMGKSVVVISRGYKGKYQNESLIVSDGNRIFCRVEDCGDEPYMMAKEKLFPVVVGKHRFKAGIKAIKAFNPDIIVLDDGFQHLKLKRDLDLLLFDYVDPLGNKRLLPAGRLREMPKSSAHRADAIIFTRSPENDVIDENIKKKSGVDNACPLFKTLSEIGVKTCFQTSHQPYIFKHIPHGSISECLVTDIAGLKGKNVILFSGIAKNSSFYLSMKNIGVNILEHLEFKDHYRYKKADILMINKAIKNMHGDFILTTQKDWVKLDWVKSNSNIEWATDLLVIGIDICFQQPETFQSFLNGKLSAR